MPVINRGDDYFAVVTYTGNGTSQTISGLRFQPDFVWIKGRSGATDHALYDAQRGVQSRLESNTTDAQVTSDNGVTAFNSDGFSIGSLAQVNTNGATYVAWCWKEGATQGFDIVTYTEVSGVNTIAHSLGVAPKIVLMKSRSTVENWVWWQSGVTGANQGLYLNLTNALATAGANWISVNSSNVQITSGQFGSPGNKVLYLFAEVAGFSKFGSYTGNGSADGPMVFTGFRPAFVMIKNATTGATNWGVYDSARNTFNAVSAVLYPNLSNAEGTWPAGTGIDILSNGFKVRRGDTDLNGSGNTLIFAAFSANPFKNALAF